MSDLGSELTALRHHDRADVYKGERLAGWLVRDRGDTLFGYQADYLDDEDAPPVALTLPKQADPVRTGGESVPAFFAGLLPEGARLTAVVTNTKTSLDDHLTLLLAVGQDTIGDVRVVPAGRPDSRRSPQARPPDPARAPPSGQLLAPLLQEALHGVALRPQRRPQRPDLGEHRGPALEPHHRLVDHPGLGEPGSRSW